MTIRLSLLKVLTVSACSFMFLSSNAATVFASVEYFNINGKELALHTEGAPMTLNNAPDYDWWYGCSATSAGMMMGYYDINGYNGLLYQDLVPGGQAESSTFGSGPYIANNAIASSGHIADFYSGGYGASGDDVAPPFHTFDSLADFMGTSQDSVGNSNGATTFWNYTDGSPLYASDIYGYGSSFYDASGMFGMWEYFDYSGYGSGNPSNYNFFNQYIDTLGRADGFSFQDYMAEIDAGRVVMIHVEGHSMFGYGYDDDGSQTIYLHDTWSQGEHSMTWGGSYSGMEHYAVTCFTPTGGSPVPIPAAAWLLGSGLLELVVVRKKLGR